MTQQETYQKIFEIVRKKKYISFEMLGPELCMETKEIVYISDVQDLIKNLPQDLTVAYRDGEPHIVTKEFIEGILGEKPTTFWQKLVYKVRYWLQ